MALPVRNSAYFSPQAFGMVIINGYGVFDSVFGKAEGDPPCSL